MTRTAAGFDMMTRDDGVLIVGAGPAGLATAYELGRRGVPCRVLERSPLVGASFALMPAGMRLVSPKSLSSLPGLDFPAGTPEYVPMVDFHRYLQRYAEQLRVPVELGADVVSVRHERGRFTLATTSGATYTGRALVAATGIYSAPYLPPDVDLARAGVSWSHAHEFVDEQPFAGRSVLVAGTGLSGQEIALSVARVARVALSGRRFVVAPRWILGVDVHYLVWPFERSRVRWLPWLVPLKEPLLGTEIRAALSSGRIGRRPAVSSLAGDAVTFSDGTRERFDHVIFATGYSPCVSWLGALVDSASRQLGNVTDCRSTRVDSLYFVGFPYVHTFASAYIRGLRRDAALVASRIAARW